MYILTGQLSTALKTAGSSPIKTLPLRHCRRDHSITKVPLLQSIVTSERDGSRHAQSALWLSGFP
jgi:hypothetical protein